MIGHSIGEYVAACLAGVFSLEDALKLVAARGRLMWQMPAGAMLAVPLSESEAQPFLSEQLSLAAINGPSSCVLSGTFEAVARVEQQLAARGVACHHLHTSHAYHSSLMEPVSDLFAQEVARVQLHAPQIPYINGLTGTWMTAEQATDVNYWSRQLREPVRFAAGIAELLKEPENILLEVGPGRSLSALARQQQNGSKGRLSLSSLPRPQEKEDQKSELSSLLKTLGQLWAAGVEIDWTAFYSLQQRRRVPLPTYPFERERYWIDAPSRTGFEDAPPDALSRQPDAADWFYVPSWKRSAIRRETVAQETAPAQNSCRLIFTDEEGLCSLIAGRLESEGFEVFIVKAGKSFCQVAEHVYEIEPGRREDYDALLEELQALGKTPEAILHAWGVSDESERAALTPVEFESSQAKGLYSLLFLAQSLGERMLTGSLQLVVVTNNLWDVTGEEALRPEKATVLGLCKVIPQEYPQLGCRTIDVILPQREAERVALADNLIAELAGPDAEAAVAYRGRRRWIQIFEPVKFAETRRESSLREGGVYLLTGGPGDIDLALAQNIAESVRCKLVLNMGQGFPERERWPQWLAAHDEQDEVGLRLRSLMALEDSGAELMLYGADVGDLEGMASVIALARERFGDINGVFHTAAVTGGGMIQLKTPAAVESVLRPKVLGTLVLQSLLKDAPPDFFLLFSTTLSLTGVLGQVDYCAANAFLDAFAQAQGATSSKTLTVAVNWHLPQWENWQESALAGASEFLVQFALMRKAYGLSPSDGAEAVRRILEGSEPQVVVSTQDFQALIDAQKTAAASDLLDQLKGARANGGGGAAVAAGGGERTSDYIAPEGETELGVARVWGELFGIERVGRHDSFFELGGNSLIAIQLVSHLRKVFQVELALSRLFEAPTVEGLARAVTESQQKARETEEIERLLKEIESLSLDELQAHLSQELQSGSEQSLDG
jgi:acyl transferase domain-containing protein